MKKKTTDPTPEQISGFLKEQQKVIHIIDKYIQSIQSDYKKSPVRDRYADFVMHHIFANIRNNYQDGIFISQGLYCHRKFVPLSKPRLCYNNNLSERSIRLSYRCININTLTQR